MKCQKCGAEMVEENSGGIGFGAVEQTKTVCPKGCDSGNSSSGWTACHLPPDEDDSLPDSNSFLNIPGWRSPWQD